MKRSKTDVAVTLDRIQAVNLRALIQNCQMLVEQFTDGAVDDETLKRIALILESTPLPKELEPIV